MPLLQFWNTSPEAVADLSVEQIVSSAGDGILRDGSECSSELRQYFAQISSETLSEYVDHCQSQSFKSSGFVLQDLINELGKRLGYSVTHGRYQGTRSAIGYDGIWTAPDGHVLVIEVKTTDAYRITLDKLAQYRDGVKDEKSTRKQVSILIVVARVDTGELEAQIRGSRHAWDIRLVSADSLLNVTTQRRLLPASVGHPFPLRVPRNDGGARLDHSRVGPQLRSVWSVLHHVGLSSPLLLSEVSQDQRDARLQGAEARCAVSFIAGDPRTSTSRRVQVELRLPR